MLTRTKLGRGQSLCKGGGEHDRSQELNKSTETREMGDENLQVQWDPQGPGFRSESGSSAAGGDPHSCAAVVILPAADLCPHAPHPVLHTSFLNFLSSVYPRFLFFYNLSLS